MIMNKSKNTYLIYFIMKYNIILFYIELCYIEIFPHISIIQTNLL